ncbi:FecR domain-containing protein [Chitinophaga sp. MM2321]|uniref:FecR domain-containing protein n=1 Tax=Chitinophaga sp. MM2321 TaxID=3137178 RepID=UPI0032D59B84
MDQPKTYHLVRKFIAGQLSPLEQQEFYSLLQDEEYSAEMIAALETLTGDVYTADVMDETLLPLLQRATQTDKPHPLQVVSPVRIHRLHFLRGWGWAAASIMVLFSAGIYFWWQHSRDHIPVKDTSYLAIDIAPGTNKAILNLADGSSVTLDSAGNQTITQGATTIKQSGGQLVYDVHDGNTAVSYNNLVTPRGGNFRVQLPDGSMVWLNAASSLRYPTAFKGKERRVELTGEAYFEVVKNAEMPFRVTVKDRMEIEVLGTSFNINAYTEENSLNATLLEGGVRVLPLHTNEMAVILDPGQQAQIRPSEKMKVVSNVDVEKIMAWKNGLFNFENASLQEVMQQLERWYNIEVVYEKGIPEMNFGGEVSKNVSLAGLLNGLGKAGVHFRIEEGRRLIVMP